MNDVNVFKRTNEDWYGNYKVVNDARVSDLVEVSFLRLADGNWRCCVWGNDDCGMEIDLDDETKTWNIFLQVIGKGHITKAFLRNLGFISA